MIRVLWQLGEMYGRTLFPTSTSIVSCHHWCLCLMIPCIHSLMNMMVGTPISSYSGGFQGLQGLQLMGLQLMPFDNARVIDLVTSLVTMWNFNATAVGNNKVAKQRMIDRQCPWSTNRNEMQTTSTSYRLHCAHLSYLWFFRYVHMNCSDN